MMRSLQRRGVLTKAKSLAWAAVVVLFVHTQAGAVDTEPLNNSQSTADGDYYLAVTGIYDEEFTGAHQEIGAYALLVGLAAVPEPCGATLAVLGVVVCSLGRRIERKRAVERGHKSSDKTAW